MWNPRETGRLGGKSRSGPKQAAARANGAKGGRPRKKPGADANRAELRAYHARFVVWNTEHILKTARVFPDLYPFNERTLRAELIRRGRRDLWLKLKRLPRPESGPSKTYEAYLEWMKELRIEPVSRTEWESHRKNPS